MAREKYKAGIYPSRLYLSVKISPVACEQQIPCEAELFTSSPWGHGFSIKDNTFSAVEVREPCLSPLPCWKNLLLFYQGLPLHFLCQVTWQCEKLGYYPFHSFLMFPWVTYPLDPSATFPMRSTFGGGGVKRKEGWNLSSHRQKSLERAIYGTHLPSYWPCPLCTFIYPLEFINYESIRLQLLSKLSRIHILITYLNSMSR